MSFHVAADSPVATIVRCDTCGAEWDDYCYRPPLHCPHEGNGDECLHCRSEWLEWVLHDAAECHDCPRLATR